MGIGVWPHNTYAKFFPIPISTLWSQDSASFPTNLLFRLSLVTSATCEGAQVVTSSSLGSHSRHLDTKLSSRYAHHRGCKALIKCFANHLEKFYLHVSWGFGWSYRYTRDFLFAKNNTWICQKSMSEVYSFLILLVLCKINFGFLGLLHLKLRKMVLEWFRRRILSKLVCQHPWRSNNVF